LRPATEPLKTQKVYLLLRDRIVSGELKAGARLPSELALASQYEVSRVTIRLALDLLAKEDLVEKRVGSGTYIKGAVFGQPVTADLSNAFAHLIEMGRSTAVKLISFEYVEAPARITEALRLEDDERVQKSVRVRSFDDVPFSYLTAYVPERIGRGYSRDDLANLALLELIERSGLKTETAWQEVGAVLANPEVAEALGIGVGSPLIALTRVVYGRGGQGMEYLQALYRPDRYSLQMNLVRKGSEGSRHWSPTSEVYRSERENGPRAGKRMVKK
jgi:GntR family transcriptional regulator